MTTTTNWLELSELCTALNTTPHIVGVSSRRSYQYAGLDTIEFSLDGVLIRKRGKYQGAKYRVL